MCECVEYDDGSLYLCPVDADIHLETEKQRNQAIALLRRVNNQHVCLYDADEHSAMKNPCEDCALSREIKAFLEGGDEA